MVHTHILTLILLFASLVSAELTYCSNQNTGSFLSSSEYQSNGLCHDGCQGYALAIVSLNDCYCSNYLPGKTAELSSCARSCSGFPSESCAGDGFYGYIQLREPSGFIGDQSTTSVATSDNTSSTSSSTTSSSTTSTTISSTSSLTSSSSTSTTSSTSSFSSTSLNSASILLSSYTSSPAMPTPVITSVIFSISTVTADQETQYITNQISTTITMSSTSTSTGGADSVKATGSSDQENMGNANYDNENSSFFDSKGKVAGVFTVVGIVGVVILVILVWLLVSCLRRRNTENDEDEEMVIPADSDHSDSLNKYNPITENSPTLKQKMEINEEELSSTDETVNNEKTSGKGAHARNLSIVSTDYGTPIIDNNGDSTYVDQRLDVGKFDENEEIMSLGDHEDYSRRVLKVTNP